MGAPATKSHSKMREKMKAKMRAKTSSLPMPHKNKQAVPVAPKKISAQIGSLMLDLEKKGQSDKKSHTDKNDAQAIQPETQQYISKLESKIADMSKSVDGLTHQVHELEEAEYARTHEKKSSAPTSNGIGPLTSMTKPTKVTATKAAEPTKVTATKAKSNSHLEEEQEEVHENDDEEKDEKDEDEEVADADEQDNASEDEKDESSQDQKEQLQDAEEDESDNSEADEEEKDEDGKKKTMMTRTRRRSMPRRSPSMMTKPTKRNRMRRKRGIWTPSVAICPATLSPACSEARKILTRPPASRKTRTVKPTPATRTSDRITISFLIESLNHVPLISDRTAVLLWRAAPRKVYHAGITRLFW